MRFEGTGGVNRNRNRKRKSIELLNQNFYYEYYSCWHRVCWIGNWYLFG